MYYPSCRLSCDHVVKRTESWRVTSIAPAKLFSVNEKANGVAAAFVCCLCPPVCAEKYEHMETFEANVSAATRMAQ